MDDFRGQRVRSYIYSTKTNTQTPGDGFGVRFRGHGRWGAPEYVEGMYVGPCASRRRALKASNRGTPTLSKTLHTKPKGKQDFDAYFFFEAT